MLATRLDYWMGALPTREGWGKFVDTLENDDESGMVIVFWGPSVDDGRVRKRKEQRSKYLLVWKQLWS